MAITIYIHLWITTGHLFQEENLARPGKIQNWIWAQRRGLSELGCWVNWKRRNWRQLWHLECYSWIGGCSKTPICEFQLHWQEEIGNDQQREELQQHLWSAGLDCTGRAIFEWFVGFQFVQNWNFKTFAEISFLSKGKINQFVTVCLHMCPVDSVYRSLALLDQ